MSSENGERDPLLQNQAIDRQRPQGSRATMARTVIWGLLTLVFAIGLVLVFVFEDNLARWSWSDSLPKDPVAAARKVLGVAPVIDGHIDLPILVRAKFANNASAVDLRSRMAGHVDIPRLRAGQVGGFFWSVFYSCPEESEAGPDLVNPSWVVRDALEQIDVARALIDMYPDTFQLALTSEDIKLSISSGKIASLLGVEGGHLLGNSLAVLRQYQALGVRYLTLTHACHNAFADSSGVLEPLHGGLSAFGRVLVREMNRLGVLIDLSHTSDQTAVQALRLSRAPVIFSHSGSRAVFDVPRGVPDDVLALIGKAKGKTDAVVMVNFVPEFIALPGQATIKVVADHIEHIANVTGKQHVGIGSDFDGMSSTPVGLEDASKYPALIAELYSRGWDRFELAGLAGANLLRILEGAERVAQVMKAEGASPAFDLYEKRPDLPRSAGGDL